MTIREEYSKILEFTIPKNDWEGAFKTINRENLIGPKEVTKMLVVLGRHIEKIEEQLNK
jgi:hypothetical protein